MPKAKVHAGRDDGRPGTLCGVELSRRWRGLTVSTTADPARVTCRLCADWIDRRSRPAGWILPARPRRP